MANEVIFYWPSPALSPNARGHWSKRAMAAKAYRKDCWARSLAAKMAVDWDGEIHLWVTFYPPDRRHRDDDNMIASFKSGRDGLADALGVDDNRFRLHAVVSDATFNGTVLVRLSRGPE